MPTSAHCHKDIAKIAKECAAASYEQLMSFDFLYNAWKKKNPDIAGNPKKLQERFVLRKWGMFIDAARATLALQLRQPIDDNVKDKIVEILALDSTLIRGRKNPAKVAGAIINK